MQELDKTVMGQRIRQIRSSIGLRQWELARLLGTTQSAVHKYEHGVIPEPRRLVELARIGGTSIEWILTGQHWENGSTEQQRVSPELLDTACALREIGHEQRATVDEALGILRGAVRALGAAPEATRPPAGEHLETTLGLVEAACNIQRALIERVMRESRLRLSRRDASGERS